MTIIAPSLIAANWWNIEKDVRDAEESGCQWLHFDAMDGQFVPNLTLGPMFLQALRAHTSLHFDAHLMMNNAGEYIEAFIDAGANSVSVHWENNPHLHRVLADIRQCGAKAGVVLNPATPVCLLENILDQVDYVLIMSVNPGFSGQAFLPLALPKLKKLNEWRHQKGLDFLLQIDGGMDEKTAPLAVAAGADVLVCGSSLFNKQPFAENVEKIRESIAQQRQIVV